MAIVDRIKNILLTPKSEWPVIAGETTSTTDLFKSYVAPLAAIPAVCGLIGGSLIGYGMFGYSYKIPIVAGIGQAIFGFVMTFVAMFVISSIVYLLGPTFGAEKNNSQAMKVTVYSFTASWVGGVFFLIPSLGILGVLCGLYSIYLLYLGLPKLMKCPEDKAVGYTAVIVVAAIVMFVVIAAVASMFGGFGMHGSGMMGGRTSPAVTFGKDSRIGNLDDFSKKMEEAGKQMEAAQKSGNQEEMTKAAMNAMSTAMGGGKAAEPLDIELLKPFVPETFAGLPRKSQSAEKGGGMGIVISKAEARYQEGDKNVQFAILDTGGAAGWMAFAGWAMVQGEKEDENGSEKTSKVDGRLVNEKTRKDGRNEYSIVLGERFIVSAKGRGVDLDTLKSALSSVDLAKLEAMQEVGIKK